MSPALSRTLRLQRWVRHDPYPQRTIDLLRNGQDPEPYLLLFSPSPTSFSLSLTQGATLMVGLLGARQRECCKRLLGMASSRLPQVQAMVKSASYGCSQDCSSREKNENLNYFSYIPTPHLDLHRESSIRAHVLSKWPENQKYQSSN